MPSPKKAVFLAAAWLGLALLASSPAEAQASGACDGVCLAGEGGTGPSRGGSPDFQPPARPKSPGTFKGHDYGASSRRYGRMSVRQGSRPYSDMERSRAFSGSDPYERGRYGRDDAAGRFSERQERENRDRGGAGGPGK